MAQKTSYSEYFSSFFNRYVGCKESDFLRLISAWLNTCKTDNLSPRTIADYSDKVARFYWWASKSYSTSHPKEITTAQLRQFSAYLREANQSERWGSVTVAAKDLSPATIASYGRILKIFLNWCEREQHLDKSPLNKSVKFTTRNQPKTIKNVETDNLAKIFKALTSPEQLTTFEGKRNLAIISLLLDSGIRRGELLSITLADLDLDLLKARVSGKTGQRTAYFSEQCKTVLLDYLRARAELDKASMPSNPFWLSSENKPFSIPAFDSMMNRLKKRAGVKFHAHQLRHTFAFLTADKVNVLTLRDLMGHSSLAVTGIYYQSTETSLADSYRPASPLTTLEGRLPGLKRRGRPRKYQ